MARIRKAIGQEEYSAAVELLTTAGCEPMFEDSDIDWIIAELLARCLPEDDHEKRKKSIWSLRNVYESNLADGSVKRLIMTFGDDADYEAVRAILQSPLAAPASKEEVEATGEPDLRSAGNRRYDALMTVVRRGVAGTKGGADHAQGPADRQHRLRDPGAGRGRDRHGPARVRHHPRWSPDPRLDGPQARL